MAPLLDTLLHAHPVPADTVGAFRVATAGLRAEWPRPVEQALVLGAHADRLGLAFAAGYAAALRALVPGLPADAHACLCVTEAEGAHPRAVHTTVRPTDDGRLRLDGEKRWATLADASDLLLVVASAGREGDRNRLVVVRVPAGTPGLGITPGSPPPFVPEVAHLRVHLDDVRVPAEALVPGDGWAEVVKPFRTVEDVHVCAAAVGYLLGATGRAPALAALAPRLLAAAVMFRELAALPPADPAGHVALAGALELVAGLAAEVEARWSEGEEAARWRRDRRLLGVAGAAREARLSAAWTRLRR